MSKNNSVVPQARAALDQFKMEAARDVDVSLHLKIYNLWKIILRSLYSMKHNQYNAPESRLDFKGDFLNGFS